MDPDELARLYNTSMVLLALSSCESFGLPVVEAMSRGLPVVAAARSSLPEVTAGAAVLVDPADVETAAAATRKLLEDGTEWQRHVRIGRQRAAELSWDRAAAGVASALRRAVSRGAG